MIRLCLVCFFLLGSSGLLAYSAMRTLFRADNTGTTVLARRAASKSDVQQFAVLRKANTEVAFHLLASLEPTNQRRHEYIGQNTPHGLGSPFSSRLQGHPKAEQVQSSPLPSHTPGAVKRSWSTIKSMFR